MLDNMLIFIFNSYNHNFMILICIQPNKPMIKHEIQFGGIDFNTCSSLVIL